METGIKFEGNAAFPDLQHIRATGQELRDLIDVAYGAHLNQNNIGKLIDAFTSKVGGVAGITDCSISGATITSNDYQPPQEPVNRDADTPSPYNPLNRDSGWGSTPCGNTTNLPDDAKESGDNWW